MEKEFKKAIALINQAGYEDISEKLRKKSDILNTDTYKIAVVGEFKAGKSTLINLIFLKNNALFTDIMEATAVPTEIHYGKEKLLKVIPYLTATYQETNPFDETLREHINVSKGEGKPLEIFHPTPEDIKAHTSAETPEKRADLARKTSRVKLYWHSDNLKGLTLFDTPGINTINEAVIATTYRIIPETDIVLFVTNAKQLSSIEIEFLSSRVFSEGITRAITVVTYDPNAGILSESQKEGLINSIRSQLANIGRDDVLVEMVNIKERIPRKGSAMLSFKKRVDADQNDLPINDPSQVINDVICDLLGEESKAQQFPEHLFAPKEEKGYSDENISIEVLEETLIQFIRKNVRPARMEKAIWVLKFQIQLALVRCATELGAMNKSESERRRILEDIKAREAEIRLKYEDLSVAFKEELKQIQLTFIQDTSDELNRIAESFIAGFDACHGLGELQNRLKDADLILKRDMEEMFLKCSHNAREKLKAVIEKYGIQTQALLNPWQTEISHELSIDGGILSQIPPFAVWTIDLLLFVHLGPFGPLADILIRFLANYIPYVNKVMPAAIAGHVLKNSIRNSVRNQFESVKAELPPKIEEIFTETGDKLLMEWKASAEEQLGTVRKSLEKTAKKTAKDYQRKDLLTKIQKELEKIITEI